MSITDTGKANPLVKAAPAAAGPEPARRLRQRIVALCRWQGVLGGMRTRPFLSAAITAGCLAIVAGICWFVVLPQWRAYQHWWKAQEAIEDGEFEEARDHLAHCVEAWPTSGETHFLMARTCRRAGSFDLAKSHLREAARLDWPSEAIDLESFLIPVQQHGARGADEQVLHRYLDARQPHPEEKLILEAMVKGYLHAFQLREARYWLDIWIRRYPDDWQPWVWRGGLFTIGRNLKSANSDLLRALELKPNHLPAHLQLGENLVKLGEDPGDALHHFELYLKGHPNDPDALVGVAECQSLLGRTDLARSALKKVLAEHPRHGRASLVLGKVELELGNAKGALPLLRQADAAEANEPGTVILLARALRELNQDKEAKLYFQKHEELDADLRELVDTTKKLMTEPGNADLRYKAGSIYLKVGRDEEGVRWLLSALSTNPKHQPTHKALADYYAERYRKTNDPKLERLAEHYRRMAGDTGDTETPSPQKP